MAGALTLSACASVHMPETTVDEIVSTCTYYERENCDQWDSTVVKVNGFLKSATTPSDYVYLYNEYVGSPRYIPVLVDGLSESQIKTIRQLNGKEVTLLASTQIECILSSEYDFYVEHLLYDECIVAIPNSLCGMYGSVYLNHINSYI